MTLQAKIDELNQAYAVAFVAEGSNAMTPEIEQRLLSANMDVSLACAKERDCAYIAGKCDGTSMLASVGFWRIIKFAFSTLLKRTP